MRRLGLTMLAATLLLSGCSAPAHQYIAANGDGMYFALPASWTQVPMKQLVKAQQGWTDDAGNVFRQTVRWQGVWSAHTIDADRAFAARPASAPVVFAYVRDLVGVEQQGIGKDVKAALRDVLIPASSLPSGSVLTQTWTRSGFTGIHQTGTYVSGGAMQTTEVVSTLPPARNRLYVFAMRCSESCYSAYGRDINAVFESLTFKEPRG